MDFAEQNFVEKNLVEKKISTKDYLTKSNLPASDYVINPYVGCPHACKYCYASFMKRFTGQDEKWGEFIDIKECDKPINIKKLAGKTVFLSSVTDCYNPFEEKYEVTRKILDLLTKLPNLKVSFSINTLDEAFRKDMDNASSIKERLKAMTELYYAGIHTVLFMSPIFPYITEWKEIIDETLDIESVNQKVLDFFPEYKLKRNQEQLKDLTIENFLTMTVPYKYKYEPYTKVFGSDNWGEKVLELIGGKEQIGERFHYSTMAICGGFMEKMKRSKF